RRACGGVPDAAVHGTRPAGRHGQLRIPWWAFTARVSPGFWGTETVSSRKVDWPVLSVRMARTVKSPGAADLWFTAKALGWGAAWVGAVPSPQSTVSVSLSALSASVRWPERVTGRPALAAFVRLSPAAAGGLPTTGPLFNVSPSVCEMKIGAAPDRRISLP